MHLSDYMTANQLTDEAVATELGCDRVTVSRYRRGKERPSLRMAERICQFTVGEVTPNDWIEMPAEAAQ